MKKKMWVIEYSLGDGVFATARVLRHATVDEAMSVVREMRKADLTPGRSYSASDTAWSHVTIPDPDEYFGTPIFEGAIPNMGKALVPGDYTAYDLFDTCRVNGTKIYTVHDDGTVTHKYQ